MSLLPLFTVAGIFGLAMMERQVFSFGPACAFRQLTGLNCPGCGGTRAFFALVHGDLLRSLHYNPLTLLLLLGLCLWLLRSTIRIVLPRHEETNLVVSERLIWWVAGLVVLFGVLRNLPWWPFTLLAPPD